MSSPWKKWQQQHWSWRERNITKHCTCTFCCFHPPSSKWAAPGVTRLQISLSSDCPLEENEYRPTQMCCEPLVKWRREQRRKYKIEPLCFYPIWSLEIVCFPRLPPHEGCNHQLYSSSAHLKIIFLTVDHLLRSNNKSAINSCSKMTSSNVSFIDFS